jgi:hypothetical protein
MASALMRVHARRVRSLVGATSATAALVVVAVLTAGGGAASDSLRPVEPPAPLSSGKDVSSAAPRVAPSPPPAPHDAPTDGWAPGPRVRASDVPVDPPTYLVSSSPRPASTYAPAAQSGRRRRPAMMREYQQPGVSGGDVDSGRYCSSGWVGDEDDWCQILEVAPAGERYRLDYTLCRSSLHTTAARLTYDTVKEADLVVRAGRREVWRWSAGQSFARRRHTLSADPGGCYTWRVSWDGVLDSGSDIPTGSYTVAATSASSELGSPTTASLKIS